MLRLAKIQNRKTIIMGEVNTGKTAYSVEVLKRFKERGETEIAVIDMAPESIKGIGGKMPNEAVRDVRYYSVQVVAPRLTGKTEDEIQSLASHNAKSIEDAFGEYEKGPSKVLFINDISLYLQAGGLTRLYSVLNSTPTVVMNGYYGDSLGGGKLGKRERKNMEELERECDTVIKLCRRSDT
jgi:hypothetical protein